MMTSLFESFDLMNNYYMSLNWIILLMPIMFLYNFWLIPSRIMIIWTSLLKYMFNEFKPMNLKFESNLLIFISLLLFIFILNLLGMFPYIFTISSQMSSNLSMAMPLWLSFLMYMLINNIKKFLYHLVPMNTPFFLLNFMVIIELISLIIRPLTLSIRLTANLIAGHLLLILLGNFMNYMNNSFLIIMLILQNLLIMLELAMSFIQAYVFSMLSLMYYLESK